MTESIRIVHALHPGLTQLDFTAPHQVFQFWPGVEQVLVAGSAGTLTAQGGMRFSEIADIAQVSACDVLCVPGGGDLAGPLADARFLTHLRRLAQSARVTVSVCTGSLLLGATGLLEGKRATCHWAWRHLLAECGATPVQARVVRDGTHYSGGGVTAGLDVALELTREFLGAELAHVITLALEYDPAPPLASGNPEHAPPAAVAAVRARAAGTEKAIASALRTARGAS